MVSLAINTTETLKLAKIPGTTLSYLPYTRQEGSRDECGTHVNFTFKEVTFAKGYYMIILSS